MAGATNANRAEDGDHSGAGSSPGTIQRFDHLKDATCAQRMAGTWRELMTVMRVFAKFVD